MTTHKRNNAPKLVVIHAKVNLILGVDTSSSTAQTQDQLKNAPAWQGLTRGEDEIGQTQLGRHGPNTFRTYTSSQTPR
jgi:hypothetical protein